jgi:F-type H+-transporting ATPase subunit delta
MSQAVASRYAAALVDVVLAPGSATGPEQAVDQLKAFEALLKGSRELRNVLLSPAVPASRKRLVVKRFSESYGFAGVVLNFLYVLIDHRRIALMKAVREEVESQLDSRRGIARAFVKSARPLPPGQRVELESALARQTGKKIQGEYSVDPDLVGGVVVRVGSTILDGSVRGRLNALRRRLTS